MADAPLPQYLLIFLKLLLEGSIERFLEAITLGPHKNGHVRFDGGDSPDHMLDRLKGGIEENENLIAVGNGHHVLEVFGVEGFAFPRRVEDEDVNAIIVLLMG